MDGPGDADTHVGVAINTRLNDGDEVRKVTDWKWRFQNRETVRTTRFIMERKPNYELSLCSIDCQCEAMLRCSVDSSESAQQ